MKSGITVAVVAIAAIVVAASCIGAAALMNDSANEINDNGSVSVDVTHEIIYNLNGGTNSSENPSTFTEGTEVVLSDPTYGEHVFAGWYTDAEFTKAITSISKDCKDDVTVYAKWSDIPTHTITYNLNGGVNSSDNPSVFTEGTEVILSEPTYEGYIFTGWYTDANLTDSIDKIGSDTVTDVILYAGWEESKVGLVLNFDFEGTITTRYGWWVSSTTTIDGTKSYSYLYYSEERGYLMYYDESYTTTASRGMSSTYSDSDTYWTDETSDYNWVKDDRTVTLSTFNGTVECEVWTGSDSSATETQYIGVDDDLPYKLTYYSSGNGSTTVVTYILTGTDTIETYDEYEVAAYCDDGITVTGSGIKDAYTTVTLTATAESGTTFKGWYNASGVCLSTKSTYTIDTLLKDTVVFALNDNDADLSFTSTDITVSPAVALTYVEWTLYDGSLVTGDVLNCTLPEGGYYSVTYSGYDTSDNLYYGYYDIFADGKVTKTYTWTYNNNQYTLDLDILYSDFLEYRNSDISRSQGTTSHDLQFVTYTDPYVVELAEKLMDTATKAGWTDYQKADFILAFTQYIEYQYDEDSMGQDEYWKYPVETLFDQNGDCEDTSILYCAIAKAAGFDCAMLLFYGHMAAAVAVECDSEYTYVYEGTTYYYCETTGAGYHVGEIPQSYKGDTRYAPNGSYFRSIIPIV